MTAGLDAPAPRRRAMVSTRARVRVVLGCVVAMNLAAALAYVWHARTLAAPEAFLAVAPVAYALGVRHAFDADHIAAIDDTTRLLTLQGRRPNGVGFFFALGHSAVVLLLATGVAFATGLLDDSGVQVVSRVGSEVSAVVATLFLLTVSALNAVALRRLWSAWQGVRLGTSDEESLAEALGNRGVVNRLLGSRTRQFVRASWHMFPVGFLFGLGLETASEVSLLALSASSVASGRLPLSAALTLPLLFAAGMATFDTLDGLLMSRMYALPQKGSGRHAAFAVAMTALTVVVAAGVGLVYLAGLLHGLGVPGTATIAGAADHFEVLGYGIVVLYAVTWAVMLLSWRRSEGNWSSAFSGQLPHGALSTAMEPTRSP